MLLKPRQQDDDGMPGGYVHHTTPHTLYTLHPPGITKARRTISKIQLFHYFWGVGFGKTVWRQLALWRRRTRNDQLLFIGIGAIEFALTKPIETGSARILAAWCRAVRETCISISSFGTAWRSFVEFRWAIMSVGMRYMATQVTFHDQLWFRTFECLDGIEIVFLFDRWIFPLMPLPKVFNVIWTVRVLYANVFRFFIYFVAIRWWLAQNAHYLAIHQHWHSTTHSSMLQFN